MDGVSGCRLAMGLPPRRLPRHHSVDRGAARDDRSSGTRDLARPRGVPMAGGGARWRASARSKAGAVELVYEALADPRVFALAMIYLTRPRRRTTARPSSCRRSSRDSVSRHDGRLSPRSLHRRHGRAGYLGWSSNRSGERRWHLISASIVGFAGLAGAAALGSSFWSVAAMLARHRRNLWLADLVLAAAVTIP